MQTWFDIYWLSIFHRLCLFVIVEGFYTRNMGGKYPNPNFWISKNTQRNRLTATVMFWGFFLKNKTCMILFLFRLFFSYSLSTLNVLTNCFDPNRLCFVVVLGDLKSSTNHVSNPNASQRQRSQFKDNSLSLETSNFEFFSQVLFVGILSVGEETFTPSIGHGRDTKFLPKTLLACPHAKQNNKASPFPLTPPKYAFLHIYI